MLRSVQHRDGRIRWGLGLRIPSSRPGLTLVELLVVVVILITLVAVTLPMMRPALEGREMREAARQLTTFLSVAQARASERGRPVGVVFHRPMDRPQATFQLSIAEVPPPYSGDDITSRAYLPSADSRADGQAVLTGAWQVMNSAGPGGNFVGPGDFIKFGYRGVHYRILSLSQVNNSDIHVNFFHPSLLVTPPPLLPKANQTTGQQNPGLEYQIFRKPQRTAAAPLELSTPAVIDWVYSGVGADGVGLSGQVGFPVPELDNPIIITFSPSGRVDRVFVDGKTERPLGTLHLLVGRADQVGIPPGQTTGQDLIPNLQDSKSLWVSIGQRTGRINTSPNNGGPLITSAFEAREFALRAQSMGGR